MKYLHTMIRVTDPDATIAFFELLGLKEVRRMENEKGRFTLIFLATPEDMNAPGERANAEVELTYNWDPEEYAGGRNFGHLAYRVENIYETCQRVLDAGHIAFHFEEAAAIFTGDTLFAMGCGRLFEGDAAQMFGNMQRYAALPDGTKVYCGHEYTQSNGRFAVSVDPGNDALVARMAQVDRLRAAGEATVPTTIGDERATNPFLRAGTVEEFARLRAGKDAFKA